MSELPGLIVDIEARVDKLEKGLARANRMQSGAAMQMERRAQQSAERIRTSYGRAADGVGQAFLRMGRGGVAALAALGVAGISREIGRVVQGLADIGRESRRAGVGVEQFQQWTYVAQQTRVPIDSLVDGFKELNLRADEWILTGAGPAAEAFKRLGFTAADLERRLEDPSELLLEIFNRVEDLDRAGQIRVFDEVFGGTGGERLVELLSRGEAGLRELMERARQTGAVMDAGVIEKAEELDRRFAELQTRTGNFFKAVAVGSADFVSQLAGMRTEIDNLFRNEAQARALLGNDVYERLAADGGLAAQAEDDVARIRRQFEDVADVAGGLVPIFQSASLELRAMGELGPGATLEQIEAAVADLDAQLAAGIVTVAEYNDRMAGLARDRAGIELARIAEGVTEANNAMRDGTMSADEFEAAMTDLAGQAALAVGALSQVDQVTFGNVIGGVQGLIDRLATAIGVANSLRAALPGAGPAGPALSPVEARRAANEPPEPVLRPTGTESIRTRPEARDGHDIDFGFPITSTGSGSAPGGGGSSPGGGGAARPDPYARGLEDLREEIAELEVERGVLLQVAASGEDYADALERAKREHELLAAAQEAGRADTPALRQEIDALVASYASAAEAVEQLEERQDRLEEGRDRIASAGESAFTSWITGATSARSAISGLLGDLAQMAASNLFRTMIGGMSGTGGPLDTLAGWLGFADGGYTGRGTRYEPAGIVHRGEFVLSKPAVDAIGVPALEGLHSAALKGFAAGGYVGPASPVLRAGGPENGPSVTINAPVTVNATGGTPAQNADLARQVGQQMEKTLRGLVQDQLRQELRPGNMLGVR